MSLRRTGGFALWLVVLTTVGCGSGSGIVEEDCDIAIVSVSRDEAMDPPPFVGKVALAGTEPERCGSDEFVVQTGGEQAPSIDGDTLSVTVSYGGGCRQHDFTLVPGSAFMESDPVQLNLTVAHDAHEDPCRAYPTEDYIFDLTPVKTLYQEAYRRDEGVMVLHLWGLHRFFYTLTYEF